ncbi:hypothetical protein GQX74_013706 [Glossina fuscipes]|nr:hypothetical protein GQX74_013706 [Glossina fuscipes]
MNYSTLMFCDLLWKRELLALKRILFNRKVLFISAWTSNYMFEGCCSGGSIKEKQETASFGHLTYLLELSINSAIKSVIPADFEYDSPFFTLVNAKVELNNMSQMAHQNMRTTLGLRT